MLLADLSIPVDSRGRCISAICRNRFLPSAIPPTCNITLFRLGLTRANAPTPPPRPRHPSARLPLRNRWFCRHCACRRVATSRVPQ